MTLRQSQVTGQTGNDDKLFDFETHSDHFAAQLRKVIFVRATDFPDEAMGMEPLDHTGDLGACFSEQFAPQVFVLEATDGELSAGYGLEKRLVLVIEEVEAFVGAGSFNSSFSDFVQLVDPGGRIIDS